jgi:hypothetical protein
LKLLEDTDEIIVHNAPRHIIKYDMITILCDNAIVSKYHLATLLYLCKHFRLNFQICPYCAHQAESIADSHAGHIKPPGKRLVTKGTTLPGLVAIFDEALGESPLKDTVVYPLSVVDNDRIDREIYSQFGGRDGIKSIDQLRTYGQLMTVRGEGDSIGHLAGRTLADQPMQWPYKYEFPRGYKDQVRQIITLEKQDENFCQRCAWVHGRPIFHRFKSGDCLFSRSDSKATKRRRVDRVEAPMEEDAVSDESGEDKEEGEDGGEEEPHGFEGLGDADLLPHFHQGEEDLSAGELVVVTGIKGEGDTYHVACVKEKWPVGRGGRKKDVQLTYYGYLDKLGYAPSWKKAGEIKERISLKKPKGHNSFDVRDIILSDVKLNEARKLSKGVRFTLAKWVSLMNEE